MDSTGKKVLIVEDDAAARDGLATILQREGYHVATLPDGLKALDYLRDGARPDLILLDMLLPVMDGWNLLKEMQSWSRPLDVPIIIMTGMCLSPEWSAANGCRGFVRKPIAVNELLAEMSRCVN
jgi:CheY-like chemotaxis protein